MSDLVCVRWTSENEAHVIAQGSEKKCDEAFDKALETLDPDGPEMPLLAIMPMSDWRKHPANTSMN